MSVKIPNFDVNIDSLDFEILPDPKLPKMCCLNYAKNLPAVYVKIISPFTLDNIFRKGIYKSDYDYNYLAKADSFKTYTGPLNLISLQQSTEETRRKEQNDTLPYGLYDGFRASVTIYSSIPQVDEPSPHINSPSRLLKLQLVMFSTMPYSTYLVSQAMLFLNRVDNYEFDSFIDYTKKFLSGSSYAIRAKALKVLEGKEQNFDEFDQYELFKNFDIEVFEPIGREEDQNIPDAQGPVENKQYLYPTCIETTIQCQRARTLDFPVLRVVKFYNQMQVDPYNGNLDPNRKYYFPIILPVSCNSYPPFPHLYFGSQKQEESKHEQTMKEVGEKGKIYDSDDSDN